MGVAMLRSCWGAAFDDQVPSALTIAVALVLIAVNWIDHCTSVRHDCIVGGRRTKKKVGKRKAYIRWLPKKETKSCVALQLHGRINREQCTISVYCTLRMIKTHQPVVASVYGAIDITNCNSHATKTRHPRFSTPAMQGTCHHFYS